MMVTTTRELQKGYKQSDTGEIPEDWESKKLGDVGEIKMCRRIFNHETKEVGVIPFYKIGTFGKEADAYIPQDLYNDYRQKFSFPKKGDILISAAGTIGRTIVYDGKPAYFQDSNIVWIDNNERLIFNNYLYYILQTAKYNTEGGTIQRLYNNILSNTQFICPPRPEQTSIATILSDTDVLIEKLEKLIAKKRAIKQGTMQELLTGKRRLPGFSGEWKMKKLGDVCGKITTGRLDANAMVQDGEFRFYTCAKEYYWIDTYAFDTEALLVSGNGANVGYIHYYKGRFNAYQRTYVLYDFYEDIMFIKLFMDRYLQERIRVEVNAGNTPYITMGTLSEMQIKIPSTREEQSEIAKVLINMDTEIEKLAQQYAKYKMLKQGMMKVLLTGRIRLI